MFGNLLDSRCDWQKETLEKYILFMTSGSRGWAKYYSDAGSLFITIKNVKDCRLHLDNVQHVQPPQGAEAARTKVQKGDLLVSVTADLGRTAVVDESTAARPAFINQHLMLLRLDTTSFDPFFVAYFMESADGKAQFSKKNMTGVKAGLNFDSLRSFRISKPPLALQQEFAAFAASVDKSKFKLGTCGGML